MSVTSTSSATGYAPETTTSELHAAVLDGRAYIFSSCDAA